MDENFLHLYSSAWGLPIQLYSSGKGEKCQFYSDLFQPDVALFYMNDALLGQEPLCYTKATHALYCGLIHRNDSDEFLIIGPAIRNEITTRQAADILSEMHQPPQRVSELARWLSRLPQADDQRFTSILKCLDYALNGIIREPAFVAHKTVFIPSVEKKDTYLTYAMQASSSMENELISYIEYGNVELMEQHVQSLRRQTYEKVPVSQSEIRNLRNLVAQAIGIASRTAYRAGLDYETMMALADKQLQKVELLETTESISIFFVEIFMEYVRRTARVKRISASTPLVKSISQDIHGHLFEKNSPSAIAERLQKSKEHLCRHFKTHTGKTISQYMHEAKVAEAQRLLSATNLPLGEIAALLGYASQNYLQIQFKQITGTTLANWRKENKS